MRYSKILPMLFISIWMTTWGQAEQYIHTGADFPANKGPRTSAKINQEIQDATQEYQKLSRVARGAFYDSFSDLKEQEYKATGGWGLLLITAITQDATEIPLARVYLKTSSGHLLLKRLLVTHSVLPVSSLEGQVLGQHREDSLYAFPIRAVLKNRHVYIDYAKNREDFELCELSIPANASRLAVASANNPEPNLQALSKIVLQEYPAVYGLATLKTAQGVIIKPLREAWQATVKAANEGHPEAQYALGEAYSEGAGAVPQNDAEAAKWFLKAAQKGHAAAQNSLGVLYKDGRGVTQDIHQAIAWHTKAARAGNLSAQYNLGAIYLRGDGVPKDDAKGLEWTQQAAEKGHAKAQANLGVLYHYGQGIPKSEYKSYFWLALAAKNGNEGAIQPRDRIAQSLTAEQLASAEKEIQNWRH